MAGSSAPDVLPGDLAAVLGSVHATAMDCLQSNLAVMADCYHGPGTSRRMGAKLRFRPRLANDSLWTLEMEVGEHLAESSAVVGVRLTEVSDTAAEVCGARPGTVLFCVSDAHDMPWLPYFQREHMDHGFLLTGGDDAGAAVVDAYDNETVHGVAEPTIRRLGWEEIEPITQGPAARVTVVEPGPLPATDPREVLRDNARHFADPALPAMADRYAEAYRAHPDESLALRRMTLETWLLARSRHLHALWAGGALGARAARPLMEHAKRCSELSARTFFALRRVEAGRKAPDAHSLLRDVLAAERALVHDLDLR